MLEQKPPEAIYHHDGYIPYSNRYRSFGKYRLHHGLRAQTTESCLMIQTQTVDDGRDGNFLDCIRGDEIKTVHL